MFFTEKLRPRVDSLDLPLLTKKNIKVAVLRLDLVDPVVSGNKWFKLKEYVAEALAQNKPTLVTFGGAFSNHILATACFSQKNGLKSVGIIRGEKAKNLSPTLKSALEWGMDLFFLDRQSYKKKEIPLSIWDKYPNYYLVNEGGYGSLGMKGAKSILDFPDAEIYTHILSAVGTGTTLAGLIEASTPAQKLIGISSMKKNLGLENEINALVSEQNKSRFDLVHDFHFGGYAKHDNSLLNFMNEWFALTHIPLDFVYTAKAFYAFCKMAEQNFFPAGSKILLIHTGGLQGNDSLKKGTLIF